LKPNSRSHHHRASGLLITGLALLAGMAAALTLAPKAASGAANQCTMIVPEGPREVMVNTCNVCRAVEIIRKRPGNDVPVQRSFTLQPGSRLQVPFLGPGRSRITAEIPCKGEPGAPENLMNLREKTSQKTSDACVSLVRANGGGIAMVNSCGDCRAAMVERKNSANEQGVREALKLKANSIVGLESKGFALVGLIGDIACP
jgi:hypothetical protein